jgi:hypothetical protein
MDQVGETLSDASGYGTLGCVDNTELIIGVSIGGLYLLFMSWSISRRVKRLHPKWIIRQLQKSDGPVKVRVRSTGGTWNPAKSGRIFTSGTAIYDLDESGTVHLHLVPKRGREQNYSGPMPASVPASAQVRKLRRIRRLVLVGYALAVIVGFCIGYLFASGAPSARFVWGLLGVFIAWMVLWLAMLTLRVGISVRNIRGDGS